MLTCSNLTWVSYTKPEEKRNDPIHTSLNEDNIILLVVKTMNYAATADGFIHAVNYPDNLLDPNNGVFLMQSHFNKLAIF